MGPAAESGAGPADFASPMILREFLPLKVGGEVLGVVGVWRDAVPILDRLDQMRREIVIVTLTAGLVAARSPVPRLPLGAGAADPTDGGPPRIDPPRPADRDPQPRRPRRAGWPSRSKGRATRSGRSGSRSIDIDNFRLLNDNHGHEAGDQALLAVAGTLRRARPRRHRDGPLRPRRVPARRFADRRRRPRAGRRPRFGPAWSTSASGSPRPSGCPSRSASASPPIPDHGTSVTTLLAGVVRVLEEAKASGGDTVRHAADRS